jgi:hypothetical protein
LPKMSPDRALAEKVYVARVHSLVLFAGHPQNSFVLVTTETDGCIFPDAVFRVA